VAQIGSDWHVPAVGTKMSGGIGGSRDGVGLGPAEGGL